MEKEAELAVIGTSLELFDTVPPTLERSAIIRHTDCSFPESYLRTTASTADAIGHPQMHWTKCGDNPTHRLPLLAHKRLLTRTRTALNKCQISFDKIVVFNSPQTPAAPGPEAEARAVPQQLVIQVSSPRMKIRPSWRRAVVDVWTALKAYLGRKVPEYADKLQSRICRPKSARCGRCGVLTRSSSESTIQGDVDLGDMAAAAVDQSVEREKRRSRSRSYRVEKSTWGCRERKTSPVMNFEGPKGCTRAEKSADLRAIAKAMKS